MTELILASGSPRRRELLAQLGLTPRVLPPDVDETQHAGEAARAYVQRVSREKARQIAARHPGAVVLAADTCVVLDGRVFGKPADASDAAATLKQLSGRTHEVLTAVSVEGAGGAHGALVETRVRFRDVSDQEARWYAGSGEPLDKAGGYAIQGRGGVFVAAIEGSYSNVVGLPLAETVALLARAGVRLPWEEGR